MKKALKSPLRYPGGKSRGLKIIDQYLPTNFSEYREPFLGGGSVFFHIKQKFPDLKYWLNDLNSELYCFWGMTQKQLDSLVKQVEKIRNEYSDGKVLFSELTTVKAEELTQLERAVRFFVLNRITFSGTVESGGFSKESFSKRFTDSSIERLSALQGFLEDVEITNCDYSKLLQKAGKDVFIFLDPPYLSATSSRLYGRRGTLHTSFDHDRFAKLMQNCSHSWMITYDDCQEIRDKFSFAYIYDWELQYGMNNYKQTKAAKGKELMITNYPVEASLKIPQQLTLNL